jgi:aminomethyltransferase
LTAAAYELHHEWEYHAIRGATALLDISPLYKYRITGPDAERLLNQVVTRDISKCAVNQVMYTPWCDQAGKVIDDGTLQRFDEQVFRLTAADPNLHWLHENAYGLNVSIEDESERVAALALQGPMSRELLKQVAKANSDLDELAYFRMTPARVGDIPVTISRTGFTGDLGYEIWLDPAQAEPLWDTLTGIGQAYGLTPVGMNALGLARIEAGLILTAVDYISAHHALIESQKSSPFELGLGWTVSLGKDNFVGRKALLAETKRPPVWRLVGLEIDWPSIEQLYEAVGLAPQAPNAAWRVSVPLYKGSRQIGYATSGCYSPILKKYIALATVEADYSRLGTQLMIEVTVEHQRKQAPAQVVKTPFFDPERKRK